QVHLVVLGPLTNVAETLAADPALAQEIAAITVMGGAVNVAGNVGSSSDIENEVAEWNIYADPYAAAEVFRSEAAITLVPLDATNDVPLTMDFYRRLERDRTTSVAEFVYRVLTAQEASIRSGGYYFWDPLAAAIAADASLSTFETLPLIVVEEESPASGQTAQSERGSPIRVAVAADRARFEAVFIDVINGRMP
ncbi:MAG: nucleoside hydrolase, partial [Anaerolineae bacterium]|nr:nucleoside hydrolase [Anaerolineae bacterium]